MYDLRNKRALVCGSTQGIGRACAMELARRGATVTLIARNEDTLKRVKQTLDVEVDQSHDYVCVDFTDVAALKKRVVEYLASTGATNILVNNMGGPPSGAIADAAASSFQQAFSNHVMCNHTLMQAVLPGMKHSGYGRIVNIISTSVVQPIKGLGVSNTIRAAVANWAKTVASELAPFGITVNNVLPGYTKTARLRSLIQVNADRANTSVEALEQEMIDTIPMGRFGSPDEIAAAVGFFASPGASYVSGVNLPVDGARLAAQ